MSRPFTEIFGMFPPGEGDVRRVAMTAARAGYAVVPVKPLTKMPTCTLNQTERRTLGSGSHKCGVHHWSLDADRIDRDFKRLNKELPEDLHLNLGVVPGPSRLIMADADTPETVEAIKEWWAGSPNILTPGVKRDGEWIHKDGGHWYWAIPDGLAMPTIKKDRTINGVSFRWGDNLQALVPPSVRDEGPYVARCDVPEAPQSILDLIFDWTGGIERQRAKKREEAGFRNDKVALWSIETTWESLLSADGWDASGRLDPGCGCPEWEKPGGGSSSRRSALAHEVECSKFENIEGHGPLHVFTDDPPEGIAKYTEETGASTLTKLQYVAWTHFEGDIEAAKVGLGIVPDISKELKNWLSDGSSEGVRVPHPEGPTKPLVDGHKEAPILQSSIPTKLPLGDSGPQPSEDHDEEEVEDEVQVHDEAEVQDDAQRVSFWLDHEEQEDRQRIIEESQKAYIRRRANEYLDYKLAGSVGAETFTVTKFGSRPTTANVPTLGRRTDGTPMLYRGRVNCVFGQSEHGKSWFTLACLVDTLAHGGNVLVIDVEDDYNGFADRMGQLGVSEDADVTYVRLWADLAQADRMNLIMLASQHDLIIVDSFDGLLATLGFESNNATGVRTAGTLLKQLAGTGNAAVLLVDHSSEKKSPGKDPKDQMGSSAKKAFIDGALLFAKALTSWKRGAVCRTMIEVGKDRHSGAKEHAIFEKDGDRWGRITMLNMQPAWPKHSGSDISLQTPPSYDDQPSAIGFADTSSLEDAAIDELRKKPGEWKAKTVMLSVMGDKNDKTGDRHRALDKLVEIEVLEHRIVPLRAGREGHEYRYVDLDEA